jgi:hypothetical protein
MLFGLFHVCWKNMTLGSLLLFERMGGRGFQDGMYGRLAVLYQVAAISYKFYRIGVMMGWTESSWGLVGRGVWAAFGPGVDPYVDVSASAWVFGIYVLSVFLWSGSFIRANKEHCVPGIKSFGQVKDAGCSMCVHGF